MVKTLHFQCRGVQVLSLVGELASHMLPREIKKKKTNLSSRILLQNLALFLPVTFNPGLTFTEQPPHL